MFLRYLKFFQFGQNLWPAFCLGWEVEYGRQRQVFGLKVIFSDPWALSLSPVNSLCLFHIIVLKAVEL